MEKMVEVLNLSKRFGHIHAVNDLSFDVHRGEVLGFLGPNGAGKSTTMKMVTCFLTPSAGTARVCGFDILKDPIAVRRRIGYLPEGAPAYPDMTPETFLAFIAEVRGFWGAEKKKRVARAVELVGLQGVLRQPIETLSKGYKRRVGLAQSILHEPEVLILDEPTDGLDPNQKHEVRTLINRMAENKVIILSTHILEEVDAVCTRSVIIAKGRLLFEGTPEKLAAVSPWHNASVLTVARDRVEAVREAVARVSGTGEIEVVTLDETTAVVRVQAAEGRSVAGEIATALRQAELEFREIKTERGRLDDVFRQITLGEVASK